MSLTELTVENLAVIERVRLPISRGFTVLTGETGAGKSLVVDALALALGARATSDLVRSGTDAARVEAIFDGVVADDDDPLADVLAAGDGMAIVRREVSADGRSLVRVNDRSVTVGGLAALGERLAEIHGQHEQQRLLAADRQLALLDRFGELGAQLDAVSAAHRTWRATVAQAAEMLTDAHELARRVELLRHQADEIGVAALRPAEDEELEDRLRAATHAEAIARAADAAVRALRDESGALDALRATRAELAQAASHDERFGELEARATSLEAEATELARDAADLGERVDLDPASRAALEERLALIYDLKRKYGETIERCSPSASRPPASWRGSRTRRASANGCAPPRNGSAGPWRRRRGRSATLAERPPASWRDGSTPTCRRSGCPPAPSACSWRRARSVRPAPTA
jgi:DNA repair protein RecN (Recombination protein N)